MKGEIVNLVNAALDRLGVPEQARSGINIERTRSAKHGDFATNAAMVLAGDLKAPPRQIAERIIGNLPKSPILEDCRIAGPGFVNFFLSASAYHQEIKHIIEQQEAYGTARTRQGKAVVEFVSANPTGPLHIGHGRGAAVGDSISRLLAAAGWTVSREFYYNDAGRQIANLALSVQARCRGLKPDHNEWPSDGYRGEYVKDVAEAYLRGETIQTDSGPVVGAGRPDAIEEIRRFAVAYLRREQNRDLAAFGVTFDTFYLESSLYESGKVEAVVQSLVDGGHTYEKDGALWLKTTDFGDDKDRVMRKSDGTYTYFVPDVAYHVTKWERGFPTAINEQGADHHSTIVRVRAGLQALAIGIPKGWPEYILHQMVTVTRGGVEVKISKRAGSYVTLRDLIDEVGPDATRFFLVARKPDSQLTFDLDLARSQSNDNPVYYIQYAHARVSSVFAKLDRRKHEWNPSGDLNLLNDPHEVALMTLLGQYPEVVETAASSRAPQQIAHYLLEVAQAFHVWYNACTILVDDAGQRNARLTLARASAQVIRNGLFLIGVNAPEHM